MDKPTISDERKIYLLERMICDIFGCQIDWERSYGYEEFYLRGVNWLDTQDLNILKRLSSFCISLDSRAYLTETEGYGTQIISDIDIELQENYESRIINEDEYREDAKEYRRTRWSKEDKKKYDHNWVKDEKGVSNTIPISKESCTLNECPLGHGDICCFNCDLRESCTKVCDTYRDQSEKESCLYFEKTFK